MRIDGNCAHLFGRIKMNMKKIWSAPVALAVVLTMALFFGGITVSAEEIEFGKDLLFENGKSFSFTAEKDGYVFIKILYDGPNRVNYTQQIGGIQSKGFFSEPGISEISQISKDSLLKGDF